VVDEEKRKSKKGRRKSKHQAVRRSDEGKKQSFRQVLL
jgi:hypothetical protein